MKTQTALPFGSSFFGYYLLQFTFCILLFSCSVQKEISRSANKTILHDPALFTAHVGISVFDPSANKYLYNHQADKYFVPASNTKIPTCYAAMKYLGDSLVAGRISSRPDGSIDFFPSGDPTFLHPEFSFQPMLNLLSGGKRVNIVANAWQDERWGSGWSWNDFQASYMAERSLLPVFGNVARFSLHNDTLKIIPRIPVSSASALGYDYGTGLMQNTRFAVRRSLDDNDFRLVAATGRFTGSSVPLRTDLGLIAAILEDTLKSRFVPSEKAAGLAYAGKTNTVYSQPTDSLLKPMMHRSDNFFAEQFLLMASNEFLGVMDDGRIIDTILKTDFKDLPQKPRWADGSGLSRYNLFTPQDFVVILNKMRNEFGMDRIKEIFPTGGEGTLSSYYKTDSTFIYAKTGTLSGVVALSGFLYTKQNKLLIFSVLVNNHQGSATSVRRAVEKFIQGLRQKY